MEELLLLVLEFVVEVVVESAAEAGVRTVARSARKADSPLLMAAGYTALGFVLGVLSLFLVSHPVLRKPQLRMAFLVLSPIGLGMVTMLKARIRRRRGKDPLPFHRFAAGALFGLTYGLTRMVFLTQQGY